MRSFKLSICFWVGLLTLFPGINSAGEIYKCVNANAEVYYNDKPCPVNEIERKLRAVKDPKGGYIPPKFVAEEEKSSSKGVVVGAGASRKINSEEKDKSDNSNKANSSNGTGTGNLAGSSASGNSKSSSGYADNSYSNNYAANQNSKRITKKRVVHKERDYKRTSSQQYDD